MIGRKPEPIPGKTPGRWRVRAFCGVDRPNTWYVERENCGGVAQFPTWREAMDYADRMARTREVTLPRQPLPLTLPGEEEDAPVVVTQAPEGDCFFLTDEDDGEMVVLYPFELRPLALALLALHYQKEVG